MKKRKAIFLFLFSATMLTGFSQAKSPVKKVYAYKQASIPGIIPSNDENDIKDKNAKPIEYQPPYNYWFYLSMAKSESITVSGLWIAGKQYEIKSETIKELPVRKMLFNGLEHNDTIIMVPATTTKVILIYPSGLKTDVSNNVLKIVKSNELVIRYSCKGKTYYATVDKITELAPDVRV